MNDNRYQIEKNLGNGGEAYLFLVIKMNTICSIILFFVNN
jgi:hypothetical protein